MSHAASAWMPFYWPDFWESEAVLGMSNDAALLYLWLLSRQWRHGSIPGDPAKLRLLVPTRFSSCFDAAWAEVRPQFEMGTDARLRNARCAEVLTSVQVRMQDNAANGRKGGLASVAARAQARLKPGSTEASKPRSTDPQASDRRVEERRGEEMLTPGMSTSPAPKGATAQDAVRAVLRAKQDEDRRQGKAVWSAAWAEHREGEEFEFAEKHSTALRKMFAKHGAEKLRRKCDALLTDLETWTFKNASPSLLALRWSSLGHATPRRMTQAEINVQGTASVADKIDAIEARGRAAREARAAQ
jgi:hypothetical protein